MGSSELRNTALEGNENVFFCSWIYAIVISKYFPMNVVVQQVEQWNDETEWLYRKLYLLCKC